MKDWILLKLDEAVATRSGREMVTVKDLPRNLLTVRGNMCKKESSSEAAARDIAELVSDPAVLEYLCGSEQLNDQILQSVASGPLVLAAISSRQAFENSRNEQLRSFDLRVKAGLIVSFLVVVGIAFWIATRFR